GVGDIDDFGDQVGAHRGVFQLVDERTVDLQQVGGKLGDRPEVGIAGAEVVHRDQEAPGLQPLHFRDQLAGQTVLGDLDADFEVVPAGGPQVLVQQRMQHVRVDA